MGVRIPGRIIPVQVGADFGYLPGFIADRLGRRPTFILFMLAAALLVPIYGQMARNPAVLMLLGPVLGYFGHGYFSMFGSFIAELYPTAVRATAQGTSYNMGRMAGAVAPIRSAPVATLPGIGIGIALGVTSAFFLLRPALIFTLTIGAVRNWRPTIADAHAEACALLERFRSQARTQFRPSGFGSSCEPQRPGDVVKTRPDAARSTPCDRAVVEHAAMML